MKKFKLKHISQVVPDKAMDRTVTVEKKYPHFISVIDTVFAFEHA